MVYIYTICLLCLYFMKRSFLSICSVTARIIYILRKQRLESTLLIFSKHMHIHKSSSVTFSLLSSLIINNRILPLRFVKLQLTGVKERTFFSSDIKQTFSLAFNFCTWSHRMDLECTWFVLFLHVNKMECIRQ